MIKIQNVRTKLPQVFFLIIIITAILLRLYHIGYNLDTDETFSVSATSSTFSHMIGVAIEDRMHPPLHLTLLFLWIKFLGNSEVSVRILSVIAALLFLIIIYRLALLLMPVWTALFVLSIYSFSPFFLYYGQQARPYSLLSLLNALSIYLLLKYRNKPSTIKAIFYSLTCAALIYTSYLSIFILIPQFTYTALFNKQDGKKLNFYGVLGMLSILYWVFTQSLLLNIGKTAKEMSWIDKPSLQSFIELYIEPFGWSHFAGGTKWLVGILGLILLFIIIRWRTINRTNTTLLAVLTFFGPIFAFIFSVYAPFSIFASRQIIGELIFFILLLGVALSTLPRWPRIILGLILIFWCTINISNGFPENIKPPWRYIANLISEKYAGYYVIVQEGWIEGPLQHYMKKEVNYFNPERLKTQTHAIFICRPFRCDKLKDIKVSHKILDKQDISWPDGKRTITNTIILYSLEKRS